MGVRYYGIYTGPGVYNAQHAFQIEKLACTTMNRDGQIQSLPVHVLILELYLIFNL